MTNSRTGIGSFPYGNHLKDVRELKNASLVLKNILWLIVKKHRYKLK